MGGERGGRKQQHSATMEGDAGVMMDWESVRVACQRFPFLGGLVEAAQHESHSPQTEYMVVEMLPFVVEGMEVVVRRLCAENAEPGDSRGVSLSFDPVHFLARFLKSKCRKALAAKESLSRASAGHKRQSKEVCAFTLDAAVAWDVPRGGD